MKKEYVLKTKYGRFKAFIWLNGTDGAYLVKFVNFSGVATFGKTLAEAKRMAKDAVELFCDCAIDDGKVIADDYGVVTGKTSRSARILTLVP